VTGVGSRMASSSAERGLSFGWSRTVQVIGE